MKITPHEERINFCVYKTVVWLFIDIRVVCAAIYSIEAAIRSAGLYHAGETS
jgi:hypothetical protein